MTILDQPQPAASSNTPEFFSRRVRSARRYYLDLAPPAAAPLAVVCGGYEECDGDYAVRRDDFRYTAIEWVMRGHGRVKLNGASHSIQAGSLFTYGPGVPHEITTDPDRTLVKHFVSFSGREAPRLLAQAKLACGAVRDASAGADLPWVFEALLREGSSGSSAAPDLCNTLLRYLLQKIGASSANRSAADFGAYDTFLRCERRLTAHATSLGSLKEFARDCGLSEAYLCRLYKRFAQQTPYQRLLRLKMNAAADRLATDPAPIRDIASELGYDDPFHFSRCFKSVLGMSPSHFRRMR